MDTRTASPGRPAVALATLLEQTARNIYEQRGPSHLHPVQWSALRFFARANRSARSVAGLARYLGVTLGPASRTVGALKRGELVEAERDPKDGRSSVISLTDKGRQMLDSDPILRLAGAIEDLPGDKATALGESLTQLAAVLKDGAESADDSDD